MECSVRVLAVIAVAIALYFVGPLIWLETSYPSFTYRYRLSISPEIDGKLHTASSVIEVTAEQSAFGGGGVRLRGQAPFLDLGERGALIFSLGEDYGGTGRAALWIGAQAFGNDSTTPNIRKLPALTGRRDLPSESIPLAIWFPKSGDLTQRRALLPQDFEAAFGPGARIASARVEITRDPIVLDIDKKLPWLAPLTTKPKGGVLTTAEQRADRSRLSRANLMRDNDDEPSFLVRMLGARAIVARIGADRASCPDCIRR